MFAIGYLTIIIMGLVILLCVALPIIIGVYVYRDAKARNMDALLWTIVAIIVPLFIGLIIYLIVRTDYVNLVCANCGCSVADSFSVCPQCGACLKCKCTKCGFPLQAEWSVCPDCGEPITQEATTQTRPQKKKSRGLGVIILLIVLIPVLLCVLLFLAFCIFGSYNSNSSGTMATTSAAAVAVADYAGNLEVTDWLGKCADQGEGIYVLQYKDADNNSKRTEYLVYPVGLAANSEFIVDSGTVNPFDNPEVNIYIATTGASGLDTPDTELERRLEDMIADYGWKSFSGSLAGGLIYAEVQSNSYAALEIEVDDQDVTPVLTEAKADLDPDVAAGNFLTFNNFLLTAGIIVWYVEILK